jgi:condensin complex subunit 1
MSKLLDSITSGLQAEVDATQRTLDSPDVDLTTLTEHKRPLEHYSFLLHWFVLAADKIGQAHGPASPAPKAKRGGKGTSKKKAAGVTDTGAAWAWENHIPTTLALISKVLRLKTHRIWTTSAERDAFIKWVSLISLQYRKLRLTNEHLVV